MFKIEQELKPKIQVFDRDSKKFGAPFRFEEVDDKTYRENFLLLDNKGGLYFVAKKKQKKNKQINNKTRQFLST